MVKWSKHMKGRHTVRPLPHGAADKAVKYRCTSRSFSASVNQTVGTQTPLKCMTLWAILWANCTSVHTVCSDIKKIV